MAKLHIYKKVGKDWSKIADGDGAVDKSQPFTVTFASVPGSLKSAQTYDVRQGQTPTGTLCECTAVAGKTATFRVGPANADAEQAHALVRQNHAAFYSALDAVSKSVQIEISADDLSFLKTNDFALCFAKKVGSSGGEGVYNVVWQSLTKYLGGNTFSWTPQYQLFGTNTFAENVKVVAQTPPQQVGLGEQCVLDSSGNLGPASTGGPDISITLINQFGTIHPGLNQLSTLNGVTNVTPLYVAQQAIPLGSAVLTPIESVLVWFE